jgi:acetyl esterase
MKKAYSIHPDMSELIEAKNEVTAWSDPEELREQWVRYGKRLSRPYPAGMVVGDVSLDCKIPDRDSPVPVRIYRPAETKGQKAAPCIVFLHGGGFIKGDLDSADSNAWGASEYSGAVAVSVDYRLAPENPYPAALNDVYGVVEYLAANAAKLGIDENRIALWGESAGGNLTAAVCLMIRDRKKGPKIAAQVSIYGGFNDEFTSESYTIHGNSIGLKMEFIREAWGVYMSGPSTDRQYAAPLKHKSLAGLPPAFLHYAEIDPIADDSPQYAKLLKDAGVPVTLRCAEGMIHGFLRARFTGTTAAAEFALPCMFLRGIFAVTATA